MITNDKAVCIRAVDYSETSQIVTFFSSNTGKVSAIAKGAKRLKSPFAGPLEVFSYGNIAFSDSGRDKLATLVEFEPVSGIVNAGVLSRDLYVLNCCLFAAELVNLLTKDYDPHPGLFDALVKFLQDVTQQEISKDKREAVLTRLLLFQVSLLKEIGLSPVFDFCVNCNSPFNLTWPEVYFSIIAKGLICRDCQGAFPDKIQLKPQTAAALADVKSIVSADGKIKKQAEDLMVHYIADILGRYPKMAKYI